MGHCDAGREALLGSSADIREAEVLQEGRKPPRGFFRVEAFTGAHDERARVEAFSPPRLDALALRRMRVRGRCTRYAQAQYESDHPSHEETSYQSMTVSDKQTSDAQLAAELLG